MTEFEFDFTVQCPYWRRGKAQDLADTFDNATHDHRNSIIFTVKIPGTNAPTNVDADTEAYRVARNRIESLIEANGWDATVKRVEMTSKEPQNEPLDNPTIDDIDRWGVLEHDGDTDDDIGDQWRHAPTDHWLAIVKDHPDSNRDWHNSMHADDLPWVVRHQFTTLGRYETEAEAIESALEWMQTNPYSLDPATTYS